MRTRWSLLACTLSALSPGVRAEAMQPPAGSPAAAAEAPAQVQDIVVTASRRQERLQDVPISVSALTAATLERKQVTDVLALSKVVPGLQSKPTLTPLEISSSIRGVTQLVPNVTIDPPIGTYVDGIYTALNAGSNLAMIDMARVEVLKGPQGTLFGRNTIGGAISITVAPPEDDLGGYVKAGLANYDAWEATGVLNLPLAEDLATRLVYQHAQHDGYGTNLTTGNPTLTSNQDYLRASLRFSRDAGFEALFSGYYVDSRGYSSPSRLRYFDPAASLGPSLPPTDQLYPLLSGRPGERISDYVDRGGFYDANGDVDGRFHLRQFGGTGTLTVYLGGPTLKSITGYTRTLYDSSTDVDGSPYKYLNLVRSPIRAHQGSQELQIFGDSADGRLSYIGGLYAFGINASQFRLVEVLSALSGSLAVSGPVVRNRSYSGFAQLTYTLADELRLTGGARYVRDTRKVTYRDRSLVGATGAYAFCQLANQPFGADESACRYSRSQTYDYVPWTIGLDYRPNQTALLYAKLSQGFRSGAFGETGPAAIAPSVGVSPAQAAAANRRALDLFAPAEPEKVLSPEVGVKLDLLDRKLRLNVAAYYSDYRNIQLSVNLPGDPGCPNCSLPVALTNSGRAHIYGGEIEATALIGALQLEASLGYTRPKYVAGPNVGEPIVNVSKLNGAVTATLPIKTGIGTLTPSSTFSYRSRATFYSLAPGLPDSVRDVISQKGFALLDASATLRLADAPITLSIFVNNLLDKHYYVSASDFPYPISLAQSFTGLPRLFGGSLRYQF